MLTIEKLQPIIDKHLDKNLSGSDILSKSIRYSTINGGKRIRPILCVAGFNTVGGKSKIILQIASAIELVHTFSLIHDDLPCMDNDDYRRGKLTNHKVFGEDIALLAGDALLNLAYDWIVNCHIPNERKIAILKEIAACTGKQGLIGGQVMDLHAGNRNITEKTIKTIYAQKTGALISAAVRIGAITAGSSTRELKLLTDYGKKLGLAFQIIDDILDMEKDKGISWLKSATEKKPFFTLRDLYTHP